MPTGQDDPQQLLDAVQFLTKPSLRPFLTELGVPERVARDPSPLTEMATWFDQAWNTFLEQNGTDFEPVFVGARERLAAITDPETADELWDWIDLHMIHGGSRTIGYWDQALRGPRITPPPESIAAAVDTACDRIDYAGEHKLLESFRQRLVDAALEPRDALFAEEYYAQRQALDALAGLARLDAPSQAVLLEWITPLFESAGHGSEPSLRAGCGKRTVEIRLDSTKTDED